MQSIDCRDSKGRTPLMLAATRAARRSHTHTHARTCPHLCISHSCDPVRLLTSLGADLFAVDHAHCTSLHHAAETHNHLAVKHLVSVGAPLNIKNKDVCGEEGEGNTTTCFKCRIYRIQGKTAYDVAMEAHNTFAMDTIAMARSKTNPQGLWEMISRQPVSACMCVMGGASVIGGACMNTLQRVAWWVMLCAPTVFLVAVGYLGELAPSWWTYLLANAVLGFLMRSFLL